MIGMHSMGRTWTWFLMLSLHYFIEFMVIRICHEVIYRTMFQCILD